MMQRRTEDRGVCKRLSAAMSATEFHTDREEDYRFLHSMLMEKKVHLLFKIHERLKRFGMRRPVPVQERAASLASQLAEELLYHGWRDEVKELLTVISKPHFKSLLRTHDSVAKREFEPALPPLPDDAMEEDEESVKIVSLVKTKEPLGATIKKDESTGAIVVARIMRGGSADKSGLIHEGDELKEVNGVSLEHRKPKEILPLLACSEGAVKFKIIPGSTKEEMTSRVTKVFVRALFDYDPTEDPTVPCKDAAVAFKRGDVLQIVGADDDTWWQARRLGDGSGRAGLVPSKQLHEKRVALQRPRALFKLQNIKPAVFPVPEDVDYGAITGIRIAGLRRSFRLGRKSSRARKSAQLRRWSSEIHGAICPRTYVEVVPYHKEPKDRHRLIVLVGPSGVGVNELKRRLVISEPDRYGVSVPYTTREKRRQESEGLDYHFVSVKEFEELILNHRFVEYGQYRGNYYGSNLDSVQRVMAEGKVCLLDVHPSKIKHVYTSGFKPYVVFVKPPRIEELRLTRRRAKFVCDENSTQVRMFSEEDFEEMLDQAEMLDSRYGHLFDKVIVNGDVAAAFRELKADVEKLDEPEVQWVPAAWMRSAPTKAWRSCSSLTGWI
ncbi:MAGUK p55 subfamily member 7-like isoform X1 [Gambusia affinis]|uniref:MAGUK p55 subfamily member 7-like isoform X1 n=1 Tax=Gambusia affinis TaxID=33528 RepID=UPI001CDBD6F3|nr:MAGUK p55 subfamily member 7-like isoform X1 [Gambusia affinis]